MDYDSNTPKERFARVPERASTDRRLTAGDLRVLILLCVFADKNGRCFPSQALLAERLQVSRQVIGKHIRRLEQFGYVQRERCYRNAQGAWPRTYYTIIYSTPRASEAA